MPDSTQRIAIALFCEESHDQEHHWPFSVDRQEELEGCIYCGVTKRQVQAKVVGVTGNQPRRRRSGSVPDIGDPPEFKEPE